MLTELSTKSTCNKLAQQVQHQRDLKTLIDIAFVEKHGHQVDVGTLEHNYVHGSSNVIRVVDRAEENNLETSCVMRTRMER